MPDTTHWIAVGSLLNPVEVPDAMVADYIKEHGECVHLVPTRVWKDYLDTKDKLDVIWNELQTYNRATFVIQAAKRGYQMPALKRHDG